MFSRFDVTDGGTDTGAGVLVAKIHTADYRRIRLPVIQKTPPEYVKCEKIGGRGSAKRRLGSSQLCRLRLPVPKNPISSPGPSAGLGIRPLGYAP